MLTKNHSTAAAVLAVALLVLSGCAGGRSFYEPAYETSAPVRTADVPVVTEVPVADPSDVLSVDASEHVSYTEPESAPELTVETPDVPDMADIESVAAIGVMHPDLSDRASVVYMDSAANPYDVSWDYGPDYDRYVDTVDEAGMWDVLFDPDFYAEAYPMLAMLYRYDTDLLLEHFQTVGIHEGRQGSAAFNVEAYIAHCDGALVNAFGDNYECYYFYWALNQESESGIDVSGDGWSLQLRAELTTMQRLELRKVNEYREDAGVDPVVFDSEIAAFACYRATVDLECGYGDHDWMASHITECDAFLDMVGSPRYTENTVHCSSAQGAVAAEPWYSNYYDSVSHYTAMVNPSQKYFGCSHMYVMGDGDGGSAGVEYDIYCPDVTTPLNP